MQGAESPQFESVSAPAKGFPSLEGCPVGHCAHTLVLTAGEALVYVLSIAKIHS